MKIHVLLLPDPEEYFFSIYIKFVNEKFCVVKHKLASFWWRHRHWTISLREPTFDQRPPRRQKTFLQ